MHTERKRQREKGFTLLLILFICQLFPPEVVFSEDNK